LEFETSKCSKWIGYKLITILYVSPSFIGLLHCTEILFHVFLNWSFFFHWLSLTFSMCSMHVCKKNEGYKFDNLLIWRPKKLKNYLLTQCQSLTLTTKHVSHFHLKLCHDSGVSHILPFTLVNPTPIQTTDNYRYMSNYGFSVCFNKVDDLHYNCLTLVFAFSFLGSMILSHSSYNFCHHYVCLWHLPK
jgi:hypothetical protein